MLAVTMKRSIALAIISIAAVAVSAGVAFAHSTPYWWSVAKARVMLQEGTSVSLPADQRAALDAELADWLRKFQPLLLTAQTGAQIGNDPRAPRLAQTYSSYIDRLKKIRVSVNSGLSIDSAKCVGQGKALVGKFAEKPGPVERRYKHFRCNASSYVLEVPNIALDPSIDPSLPEVVEGSRRLVGPFQAGFTVHVTGNSRMVTQRTS
jgi:hypothetical protein